MVVKRQNRHTRHFQGIRGIDMIKKVLLAFLLSGCGYLPIASYTKSSLEGGSFVDIKIFAQMPESSTSIKDAINNAILSRFQGSLMDKETADNEFEIIVQNISQNPIAYNKDGFVSIYRTNVVLEINFKNKKGVSFSTQNSGFYDYSADFTSTIVLEQYKIDSITQATGQILDRFISQVAYYGEYYKE